MRGKIVKLATTAMVLSVALPVIASVGDNIQVEFKTRAGNFFTTTATLSWAP